MSTNRSEDWIDSSWIENYLTNSVRTPDRWLFIHDTSQVFPSLHALQLFDREYEVIFFEEDLRIRQSLERYKDNPEPSAACIVSRQSHETNLHILDYIVRSQSVEMTPQSMLEFAQPEYSWTHSVNQLWGGDFWTLFERLQAYRLNYPRSMTPAEATNLLLSTQLDTDLRANLSVREAVEIWQRMERDTNLIAWSEKYPRLFQALNLKVRAALPLMDKLEGDADFVHFLWTSYSLAQHNEDYDLFLPELFGDTIWKKYGNTPPEEIWNACPQLIRSDPERVIDQIRQTEIWLTQDQQRLELFQRWVGLDAANLGKTIEYVKKEILFCVPVREALRLLAAQLCHFPESLEAGEIHEIIENIQRQHLFQANTVDYLRIKDVFRAFTDLVALNQLITRIEHKSLAERDWRRIQKQAALNPDKIEDVTDWGYQTDLSKLELMAAELEQLNFQCDFLPAPVIGEVLGRVKGLIDEYNIEFAQRIATSFPTWTVSNRDKPLLTVDFLDTLFLPRYQQYLQEKSQSAYIFMFDGMRWDAWEAIKPEVLSTFQGQLALDGVFPLVSILPSTTAYNKYAIFTGEFPSGDADNDWEAVLIPAFQKRRIHGVRWIGDSGNNQAEMLALIEAEDVAVKVFNFTFIDQKLQGATQNLSTVYEEVKANFERLVQPYLERVPSDSLIFLISDRGFIESTDSQGFSEEVLQMSSGATHHQRYIDLATPPTDTDLGHFVFFSAEQIGLQPADGASHYGFATGRTQVLSEKRYVHGGVSIQEMLIPCVVFVPTAKGQLEMFPLQ
ncbi:hypothetical protein C6502_07595 [Candidatus Poribacteria bacterium]|nr:MAG: hypothetical protein C6502_07595 [Candidatus Poribacteria bacterium]